VLLLTSACGITHPRDLNFRTDDRLHFSSPADRAKVEQPVTVSWHIRDFRVTEKGHGRPGDDAGFFAVFVDRAPVKPGQTLDAVAGGDPSCERDPRCPDETYLRQHRVFATTSTSLKLPQIANLADSNEKVQLHSITVVLLDSAGRRIGESAWQLDVRIPKAEV
jgi:hypothetical protein